MPYNNPKHDAPAAITRRDVEQYFTGAYLGMLRAHQRLRTAILIVRAVTIMLGAILLWVALYLSWREAGAANSSLVDAAGTRLNLILAGLLLCVGGAIPWLWRFGWELPAALFALMAGAEVFYFHLGHRGFAVALLLCAIAAIAYGVRLRMAGYQEPLDLQELEGKLDAWTDDVVEGTIEEWAELLPATTGARERRVLRTFPKQDLIGNAEILCRLGSDSKLRITPLGIAMFEFGPDSVLVYEGAVDLRRLQVLYSRAHEFGYRHIAGLHWYSDAVPERAIATAASMIVDRVANPGAEADQSKLRDVAPRQRDRAEVRLVAGEPLSIVFLDTSFLPRGRSRTVELQPLEDPAKIRELWAEMMRRQQVARANAPRSETLADKIGDRDVGNGLTTGDP